MWNGSCRHPYGVGDLMHLYRKRLKMVPFFRDASDYQDFQDRPWWMWGSYVLAPVIREMKQRPQWRTFSKTFKVCVQLLLGGFAEVRVDQVGVNWDFHESRANLDKMMKHLAPVWLRVLNACANGLRGANEPKRPAN